MLFNLVRQVVRFDIVKAPNQFGVAAKLQRFYQAEVLVPSPVPANLIVFPDDVAPNAREKLKPKLPTTGSTVFCKARRSNVCSCSTSESSSTTPASSTASIVLLAEGEAATSLALQSAVISVVGGEGGKLFVNQDSGTKCASLGASASSVSDGPAVTVLANLDPTDTVPANRDPADPVPANFVDGAVSAANSQLSAVAVPADSASANLDPIPANFVDGAGSLQRSDAWSSQCFGFEHEGHEYCSTESVATWIWVRGPVPPGFDASLSVPAAFASKKSPAVRGRAAPASPVLVPVPAASVRALPGAKKLHAARGDPAVDAASVRALPGAKNFHAARGREDAPAANTVAAASVATLLGAKNFHAARGCPCC
jgi:hypothetical protein